MRLFKNVKSLISKDTSIIMLSLSKKRRQRENIEHDENDNEAPSTSKRSRRENEISRLSQSQIPTSVRCGKILRIHLENFMCHENYTVKFNERLNFVVGSNGSGKSALMAALVLGLGSKARATNRSGSMKDLIRSGQNAAKIEITFSNAGLQAFEHDTYGDKITVVRNISQYGANYVIKNEKGRVISRKFDDLSRILIYHNMQADNPIFVLNQDKAREFLKELDPSKNYEMFLKATQMELIGEQLNSCFYKHRDQCIQLQCMKKKIANKEQEVKELENKLELLINLEALKSKLKCLEVERTWLLVTEEEKDVSEFAKQIDIVQKQQEELQRFAGSKSQMEKELESEIRLCEEQKKTKLTTLTNHQTTLAECKKKLTDTTQTVYQMATAIETLKKKKSHIESQINDLQNNLEQRASTNTDELKRQDEILLNQYQQSLSETNNMLATTKKDIEMFMVSKAQADEQEEELQSHKNRISAELHRIDANIATLTSSTRDKLSAFGSEIPILVSEIEKNYKAGRFSEKPRGPVGQYVEVPNNKYRSLVESQIGNLIKGFIVNNAKDRQMLESIIQRVCPQFRCPIITTKFSNRVYNISQGCVNPPNGTQALINEIVCKDPVVMNCLIDRLQIETVLFTESKDVAEHLASSEVPKNMSKIIVSKFGVEYYPEPKYRMYSINIPEARFIQVDVQQRIAALQQDKRNSLREQREVEIQLQDLKKRKQENINQLRDKRLICQRQETQQKELLLAIKDIKEKEYPHHNEIDLLKGELCNMQKEIDGIDDTLKCRTVKYNELCREMATLAEEHSTETAKNQRLQREIELIEENIDEIKLKKRRKVSTFEENKKKLLAINDQLKTLMREKQERERKLRKLMEDAQKVGDRIETNSSESEIVDEIEKIKAQLRQRSHISENVNDLRVSIRDKSSQLQMEKSILEKSRASITMLKKSLILRQDFLKKLKQHMVLLLQYAFNFLLKERGFVGSVEVDHKKLTLDLSVIPRDKNLENAQSSTRALSGGERSYSTVAFLVALWSCVDHPFYFLDEYDVFTDVVNRECITKLLIHEGENRPNRQYTFLTPQDMSLSSNDILQIHRLAPPERR